MEKNSHKISLEPLERNLQQLLAALNGDDDLDLLRIDKITRALLIGVRTFEQMRIHKAQEEARKALDANSRFEDLKRPVESERIRIADEINRHFQIVEDRR